MADDVALPLGALRLRRSGSAGGHNGLKDIILRLGRDDFPRLRIGVGAPGSQAEQPGQSSGLVNHVLGRFGSEDEAVMQKRLPVAVEACLCWASLGTEAAMNKFNAPQRTTPPAAKEGRGERQFGD